MLWFPNTRVMVSIQEHTIFISIGVVFSCVHVYRSSLFQLLSSDIVTCVSFIESFDLGSSLVDNNDSLETVWDGGCLNEFGHFTGHVP